MALGMRFNLKHALVNSKALIIIMGLITDMTMTINSVVSYCKTGGCGKCSDSFNMDYRTESHPTH